MSSHVKIFDTTLRDGEQTPGVGLTPEEKLQIARQLARLGVDVIEAGFPCSSPGDFQAVKAVADQVDGPVIAGLCRTSPADLEAGYQALKGAKKPRIHTFIATSPIHMEKKLRMKPDAVVAAARDAVTLAKSYGMEVEFSAEDATRSDPDFLVQIFRVAKEAGATIINVPDTVGYTTPKEYYDLMVYLGEQVGSDLTWSVHCHDDLGMAVANSLAAIAAGVTQIECTINGVGERAGNASMEEIVMALRTRGDHYGARTTINCTEITRTSRMVSSLMGIPVQPNKAIVGANAFAHQSGIHQDGVIKARQTYEIMQPDDVGAGDTNLVLGKNSGRAGFKARLSALGYTLEGDELNRAFQRFKDLADRKRTVTDRDLEALIKDERAVTQVPEICRLDAFQVVSGNQTVPTATVRITREGVPREEAASGNGSVDALYRAIDRATGFEGNLLDYAIRAVTDGQDALGEVTVQVGTEAGTALGRGVAADILEASARAYMAAINKILSGLVGDKKSQEAV